MAEAGKTQLKERSKGLLAEFEEFISRGSVVDLAVGMIIGAAFTAIVTSLIDDIVMPVLGLILGGINFSDLKLIMVPAAPGVPEVALYYGTFINAVINFLAIAVVVFLAVKAINATRAKFTKANDAAAEKAAKEEASESEVDLLKQIRDAVVNQD